MSNNGFVEFEVNDLFGYQGLVDSISMSQDFEEMDLGDPRLLNWDYEFLMTVIQTIATNYQHKLMKINGFSIFWMTADYIYQAMSYALANNRKEVGKKELINVFKYWDYVPLEVKLDVLDDIFLQEEIDYSEHPYKISKPRGRKQYQKIISFPNTTPKSD